MSHKVEIDLDGSKVTMETGKIAKQANGAVVVRSGDSVVLVTACANAAAQTERQLLPAHRGLSRIHLLRRASSRAALSSARAVPRRKKFSPAA